MQKQIKLTLIFALLLSSLNYTIQLNAGLLSATKRAIFATGLITLSYWILQTVAKSEKDNGDKNGPAGKLKEKIDLNAKKAEKVIVETAKNCKESINKNFDTDLDLKFNAIKKETKCVLQQSYDWIGHKLGFKNDASNKLNSLANKS